MLSNESDEEFILVEVIRQCNGELIDKSIHKCNLNARLEEIRTDLELKEGEFFLKNGKNVSERNEKRFSLDKITEEDEENEALPPKVYLECVP
jgi:hypothetical protein